MNKTTAYILALFAVLSGIVYFGDAPERILGTSNAIKNEVNAIPFSVARGTTTTHYEKDGSISYTFAASRLEHYRDEKQLDQVFTLIDQPQLIIYQNEEPWFVRAQKGKITSVDQNIELWQGVVLLHTNEEGMVTTVNTEKLNIDPVHKLANTKEPVRISAQKAEIEGIGMDADLSTEKLTLLSQVRGIYDPN